MNTWPRWVAVGDDTVTLKEERDEYVAEVGDSR